MGATFFITMMVLPLGAIIVLLFRKVTLTGVLLKIYNKLKYFVFWNGTLVFVTESYANMSLAVLAKLAQPDFRSSHSIGESAFAICLSLIILFAPMAMSIYFIVNHMKFRDKEFLLKFN